MLNILKQVQDFKNPSIKYKIDIFRCPITLEYSSILPLKIQLNLFNPKSLLYDTDRGLCSFSNKVSSFLSEETNIGNRRETHSIPLSPVF